jgi:hypothetical protein
MVTTSDDDTPRPQRPTWACLLHSPPTGDQHWVRADDGYVTCEGCLAKLRKNLADVADRYNRLDPTPGATGETGTRGAPGFRSTPAASLHIVALRDHRSSTEAHIWRGADKRIHAESTRAPASIRSVLETEAVNIAELRGMDLPTGDVADLVRWLDRQLDWLTRERIVVEFAAVIRGLRTQLMPVTGDPRIWVATCPNIITADGHQVECGANLYYPSSGDTIMCGNPPCKRKWHRTRWNGDSPDCLSQLIADRRAKTDAA